MHSIVGGTPPVAPRHGSWSTGQQRGCCTRLHRGVECVDGGQPLRPSDARLRGFMLQLLAEVAGRGCDR